jgi:undecaprenyl-diphosphatase
MSAALVALGLTLSAWFFAGPVGGWDARVVNWFADQRSDLVNGISTWGSRFSDTLVIVVGTATVAGFLLARRHWPDALFLVLAPAVEVTAFLVATLVVDRDRPGVVRLDEAPPTSSFPSGHVAAAVAFYVALALVVSNRTEWRLARLAAWLVAIVVPLTVAWSRMYRGMHYPTDVAVGYVAGLACVVLALVTVRTVCVVAARRAEPVPAPLEVLT